MIPLFLGLLLSLAPAYAQATARAPAVSPALQGTSSGPGDAAVVIGNEEYDELSQSMFSRSDARAWSDWLTGARGLRSNRVSLVQDARRVDMLKAIKRGLSKVGRGGTAWVVYSGHGAMSAPEGGRRLLLGKEARADAPWASGLSLDDIAREALRNRKIGRLVLIVDAGFDGRGRDGLEIAPGALRTVAPAEGVSDLVGKVDESRVVVWAASRGAEPVTGLSSAGLGAFTWASLGALRGWADGEVDGSPDQQVSLMEADAYVLQTLREVGSASGNVALGGPIDLVLSEGTALEAPPAAALLATISDQRRSQRLSEAQALLQAEAAAFWQHTLDLARQGGEEGRQALLGFVSEFGGKQLTLTWPVALPEVRQARQLLARYGQAGEAKEAVQEVVAVARQVQEESCDDLIALEPDSMMGQLSEGRKACLERRVATERLQTARERASLVLIVNAQAAGDREGWASLVERHLDRISRADPNLVMQYAVYLFTVAPVERGEDVIHWAEVALENKRRWDVDSYTKNVAALQRLRAETAYKLWMDADKNTRNDNSEQALWLAEEWRGLAKGYAREWLEYMWASGQDPERALQVCTSAAGTVEFCRAH